MTTEHAFVGDPIDQLGPANQAATVPSRASQGRPPSPPGKLPPQARRVVVALSISTFIEWFGAGAVLPLLPLYLRDRGASDLLVGIAMAAFYVTGVVVQYPAGRLADRRGRRPLLLAGLVTYSVSSLAFTLTGTPLAAVVLRGGQGIGSGITGSTAAAIVAETVPEAWRGRAFGMLNGATTLGLAIGPLVGSLIGSSSMRIVFILAGSAALVATIPVMLAVPGGRLRSSGAGHQARRSPHHGRPLRSNPAVRGTLVAMTAVGLVSGMYEVCWTLLLHARHAVTWEIGLSWTLFAIPFVVVSVPAGWLVDHLDRRMLAAISLGASAIFASLYPFLPNLGLIIGLGAVEAVAVALAYPAVLSLLSQHVAPTMLGRAQGLSGSFQTGATAVAAAAAGAAFGVAPFVPFVIASGGVVVLTGVMLVAWRRVPGRIVDG
jgi:DHA1 family multidrug resistance protein-like MFS transporter